MPVGVWVTMTAKAGAEAELLRRVKAVMAAVRTEPGNLAASVLCDPSDPSRIFVFEVYRDQAAIEAHRRAEHSQTLTPMVRELYGAPLQAHFLETCDWAEAAAAMKGAPGPV